MRGKQTLCELLLLMLIIGACATHRKTQSEPQLDKDLTDFDTTEDFSLLDTESEFERANVAGLERAKYGEHTDLYAASEELIGFHADDEQASAPVEPERSDLNQAEIDADGFEPVFVTPAPLAPTVATASSIRVVLYVKTSKAAVRRHRVATALLVRTLELGTAVLVMIEGTWARLGDEGYIALDDLSFKPVPVPKVTPPWPKFSAVERAARHQEPHY